MLSKLPPIGALVEFEIPNSVAGKYIGFYRGYNKRRLMHWITSTEKGNAGWLIEPEQFLRILKVKKSRKAKR